MTAPALARPARKGEPGFTTGGRVYEHPVTHKVAPSITAVIAMLDKPALKYWAAKMCGEFAADNVATLAAEPDRDERLKLVKGAPWAQSSKSANDGDVIHDWIDRYIKGTGIDHEEFDNASTTARHMWQAFRTFCQTYNPEWIDSEFTVWSDRFGYAGTADWAARIGAWTVLGDTKTGKNVYPEVGLQIAAIANADYIIEPGGSQRSIPAFDRFAVLHVRPTFTRLHPLQHMTEGFEAFKAARVLKYWKDSLAETVISAAPKLNAA